VVELGARRTVEYEVTLKPDEERTLTDAAHDTW